MDLCDFGVAWLTGSKHSKKTLGTLSESQLGALGAVSSRRSVWAGRRVLSPGHVVFAMVLGGDTT